MESPRLMGFDTRAMGFSMDVTRGSLGWAHSTAEGGIRLDYN